MALALSGCIGTDVVPWPVVESRVVIATRLDSLAVGEQFQLEAEYYDTLGMRAEAPFTWTSMSPDIVSVTEQGLAEALAEGEALVTVYVGEATDTLTIYAGDQTTESPKSRSATLSGLSSYRVSGTAVLEETDDGLVLGFSSNFSASSGPGLYVYLSNQATNVTGGVELGMLQANSGAQTYAVPEGVTLMSYNYVLIYCKPFGVPFGNGQFSE